ncbi:MAG: hypothetical protein ABIQ52_19475 [Vicinamibacterales bacterium]
MRADVLDWQTLEAPSPLTRAYDALEDVVLIAAALQSRQHT